MFCLDTYNFHDMKLAWLDGGVNFLDGGTMFGVVPKALWSRKYACRRKQFDRASDRSDLHFL